MGSELSCSLVCSVIVAAVVFYVLVRVRNVLTRMIKVFKVANWEHAYLRIEPLPVGFLLITRTIVKRFLSLHSIILLVILFVRESFIHCSIHLPHFLVTHFILERTTLIYAFASGISHSEH